jgi:hypothetical protein
MKFFSNFLHLANKIKYTVPYIRKGDSRWNLARGRVTSLLASELL